MTRVALKVARGSPAGRAKREGDAGTYNPTTGRRVTSPPVNITPFSNHRDVFAFEPNLFPNSSNNVVHFFVTRRKIETARDSFVKRTIEL